MELSEESRRDSRISLDVVHSVSHVVDSYRIPVIFDKDSERQEAKARESLYGKYQFVEEIAQ